jgi:5'-3' exonuclease
VREYKSRERAVDDTPVNTPLVDRTVECYVNPLEHQWEARYYSALFQSERFFVAIQASDAFLKMLDWNMNYYTSGCPNWTIYYPYMYPPLLADLAKAAFEPPGEGGAPATSTELLKFVLPIEHASMSLIPYEPSEKNPECYWAFCTFLWESHLLF